MDDTISRQAVIDEAEEWIETYNSGRGGKRERDAIKRVISRIKKLPSAEPEIIRCKDCKYQDENQRRVSVKWLPCMDVRTGSNWYCGSAERKENSDG